jgi:hypothetical protein
MSNCLIFALLRRFRSGAYLISRRSHFGWWNHYSWSADMKTFESFVPVVPNHKRRFPPLIFRGRVQIGTEAP